MICEWTPRSHAGGGGGARVVQLCQHPPLAYHLYRVQGTSQDRADPLVCRFSFCLCQYIHLPSRQLRRREQMLQQSRTRSLAGYCTLRQTSVSSAGGGNSGPSCTGCQCLWSSPVCCLGEHPATFKTPLSQCHQCSAGGISSEVHNHLLCLAGVDLESVGLTPADKVTDDPPVFLVVPITYSSNDGRIIWKLLDMAVVRVVPKVSQPYCLG